MNEDTKVPGRSIKKVESLAAAWRETLGVLNDWKIDIVRLVENKLPQIIPQFALVIKPDSEMGDAEAFTEFDPPRIVARETVYRKALRGEARSRMTFAHELGHLVMHAGVVAKPRMAAGNEKLSIKPYESAEWQARKFAAFFLMPTHIVMDFATVHDVMEHCGVSELAARIRFAETKSNRISKPLPDCVRELIEKIDR
jgi:Zn-dependent peptidase ImmA (M78 family)